MWKQSLPTEPGWYWLKQPHEAEPEIVHVRLYVNDLAIGNSRIVGWPSLERSLWSGPIPEPSMPANAEIME